MTEAVVKLRDLRGAHAAGSVLDEPFAESIDKRPVLTARNFAGAFNVGFGGAKSDVFHIGLPSLVHLVPGKLATCIDVAQPLHQRPILPRSNTASNTSQPVAEEFMQLGVPTSSFLSGKLNVSLVGIEDSSVTR
jgi:hypothetical protein